MNEGGEGSLVNMYAQLDSQEMPIPKDLSDYWQDPSSYFLIPGENWPLDSNALTQKWASELPEVPREGALIRLLV